MEGDPTTKTSAEIDKYIEKCIDYYIQQKETGEFLYYEFFDDFRLWDENAFSRASSQMLRKLRITLYDRGVYTPRDKTRVSIHLHNLLINDYTPWPQDAAVAAASNPPNTSASNISIPTPISIPAIPAVIPPPSPNQAYTPAPTSITTPSPAPALSPAPTASPTPSSAPTALTNQAPATYKGNQRFREYKPGNLQKELSSLLKNMDSNTRYGGRGDFFDEKLERFLDRCEIAGVPPEGIRRAFHIMLKDAAEDFYNTNKAYFSSLTMEQIFQAFRENFEGRESQLMYQKEWDAITLAKTIESHPDKTMEECLDILIQRLRKIQPGLAATLRSQENTYIKLRSACIGVRACEMATRRPAETLQSLIHDLRSSAMEHDYMKISPKNTETMFTDRKYKRLPPVPTASKPTTVNRSGKKCFVCHKEGCWSTNHPAKERDKGIQQLIQDAEGLKTESSDDEDLHIESDGDVGDQETFFTSFGPINGKDAFNQLANQATAHAITKTNPKTTQNEALSSNRASRRYTSNTFFGIMIDTGAAYASSAGFDQLRALQREQDIAIDASKANTATFKFGMGVASSKGIVTITSPLGKVTFHVVEADTPFLLSLADLDAIGYYYNNLKNCLCARDGSEIPVARRFGHPFLTWGTSLQSYCIGTYINGDGDDEAPTCQLSDQELRQLHRRFGHPSPKRLIDLLTKSGHEFDKSSIRTLTKFCISCQKHARPPGRFRFTIKDDMDFNCSIIIDIMYLDTPRRPVLHVIDEATRFQAAKFLKNISSSTIWNALRKCWIDTYLGPPDMVTTDSGTQFTAPLFKVQATSMGITTYCVPIEAHHSIGMVERYHTPLRRAFEVIDADIGPCDDDPKKRTILQMAVKAVNDTAGPNGLTPTLLAFGAYPRMVKTDISVTSITMRRKAIDRAMQAVSEIHAKRNVEDALRHRSGPDVEDIQDALVGSEVLVFRESGNWDGPFKLEGRDLLTCTVTIDNRRCRFPATAVKRYRTPEQEPQKAQEEDIHSGQEGDMQNRHIHGQNRETPRRNPARDRQIPIKFSYITTKEQASIDLAVSLRQKGQIRDPAPPFKTAQKHEIQGLIDKGVFALVRSDSVKNTIRIFHSRFVNDIKYKDGAPYEKSRLVVQAYNDAGKSEIMTQSPTIQRASQRLIMCFAMIRDGTLCTRDISQAYTNSADKLNRKIYVKPPLDTDLGSNLLCVIKPLYGIPEAGAHWFKTYHEHHLNRLNLTVSSFDPCLMFSDEAVVGLQTDDTLFLASPKYMQMEDDELHKAKFPAKPVDKLSKEKDLPFNGTTIGLQDNNTLLMTQTRQCAKISQIDVTADIKTQYVRERARGAYVSSMCQPEASFALSRAAQSVDPDKDDVALLNKCLKWQKDNSTRGLTFIRLTPDELKLLIFVDAAFANNKDLSSQIGFVIMLANERRSKDNETITATGNLVHWSSTKCKRVTRSVLASELYAMVAGFDIGAALQSTASSILRSKIPLALCTDSFSLYDCMVKLGTTAEKRLMIDIMGLRQSYERREIDEIRWIDGTCNPADAMTKDRPCQALTQLVDSNTIVLRTNGWVERAEKAETGDGEETCV